MPHFFLCTRKFREYLFQKIVLIYQDKTTPRGNYFLGNYDLKVGIMSIPWNLKSTIAE